MNSQRIKTVDISPSQDNRKIEGKRCEFKIPGYGQLKMLFLLFDVASAAPISSTQPTSFIFVDNAELVVDNTFVIAQVNDISSLSRLDKMERTEYAYVYDNASSAVAGGINSTEKTVSMPLFFWPIDGQMINTDTFNLSVKLAIKNTYAKMGLGGVLTTFNVRLRAVYDNFKKDTLNVQKSYNSFYLPPTEVLNGSTSSRVFINLPYAVYSMAFSVRKNSNYISALITKITLKFPNGAEETYDQLSNYFIGTKLADNDEIFSITFNDKFADQVQMSNRPYQPITATIYYKNPLEDANLFVTYDYNSTVTEHSDPSLGTKFLSEENNIRY